MILQNNTRTPVLFVTFAGVLHDIRQSWKSFFRRQHWRRILLLLMAMKPEAPVRRKITRPLDDL